MTCMEKSAHCYSNGFLGIIIEDKENLSGPACLEVNLTICLEIFISNLLFFFLIRDFNNAAIYSRWSH